MLPPGAAKARKRPLALPKAGNTQRYKAQLVNKTLREVFFKQQLACVLHISSHCDPNKGSEPSAYTFNLC